MRDPPVYIEFSGEYAWVHVYGGGGHARVAPVNCGFWRGGLDLSYIRDGECVSAYICKAEKMRGIYIKFEIWFVEDGLCVEVDHEEHYFGKRRHAIPPMSIDLGLHIYQ